MKIKNIFLIIIILFLSSCRWIKDAGKPVFAWTNITVPEGTPVFQQGYKDGCSTSVYARGNFVYKLRYGYRYDANLIGNSEYRFGHQRGYTFCFLYALQYESGANTSPDTYILPWGGDSFIEAGDINDAWGGFFGGLDAPIKPNPSNGFDSMFGVWSGGSGGGALSANPLWAGGSHGQFFGQ